MGSGKREDGRRKGEKRERAGRRNRNGGGRVALHVIQSKAIASIRRPAHCLHDRILGSAWMPRPTDTLK